jgi:hypothetical protein
VWVVDDDIASFFDSIRLLRALYGVGEDPNRD